ncbi:hypothetical protein O163_14460 [Caldanaerobacter subterraneus subsp. yonseiensis KB-1]|uniref:Uncharacterized protein n=1 Tax=Caldanaerobacter subterraneus subsp. yonseiensis KB-1 TaxID=1388761 RepID=U5CP40_CALSX|nr:hypothetical protein O163_14460 [Caldanaerobacter subterraneus subsp. yonseiensis KB-1]
MIKKKRKNNRYFYFSKRRNLKKYVEINNTGWEIELCKRQKDLGNCTRNR